MYKIFFVNNINQFTEYADSQEQWNKVKFLLLISLVSSMTIGTRWHYFLFITLFRYFINLFYSFHYLFLFLRDADSKKGTLCPFCVPIHKKKKKKKQHKVSNATEHRDNFISNYVLGKNNLEGLSMGSRPICQSKEKMLPWISLSYMVLFLKHASKLKSINCYYGTLWGCS